MKSEIISIGNEFLAGRTGHSAPVASKELLSLGLKVERITTVGDVSEDLSLALKEAIDRADVVITIGGLGSTSDDITRKTISKTLGIKEEFSRPAMENVGRYFANLGKDAPKGCDDQGNILVGAKMLENACGSSPGQLLETGEGKILIVLPGPKEEVEYIIKNELHKYLKDKYERLIRKSSVLHIIDMCENELMVALKDIIDTEKHLDKGEIEFYYEMNDIGTELTIECWGSNELLVDEILHKTKNEICNALKDNVYGADSDTIESTIGRLFSKNRKTLATAESCTGGLLASRITDAAGSSIYYKQSVVTYSNDAKVKMLGIDPDLIKEHGAVSEEIAGEMASKMLDMAGTDYAVSITGYAGPAGGKEASAGTGYIALKSSDELKIEKIEYSGSRKKLKNKFLATALSMLWKELK